MKNLFSLLILSLITIPLVIAYKTPFSFCDTPRTYKLGTIDPRFDLKQAVAIRDIDESTKILNSAYGKTLFDYASVSGEITINFVYDERSALDSNINKQKSQISNIDTSLQKKITAYQVDVKNFQQKLSDLNAKIQKYNNEGGAPLNVYNGIIDEQNQLKVEGDVLNARANELNLETHNFNSNVADLNQNVNTFNSVIAQKPEEGLYDGANHTISIYFVSTKAELIHTLAHELGHAIGMNHVADSKAIMYPQTSEYLKFTEDDNKELHNACKSFPLLEYWIYRVINNLHTLI